MCTKLDSSIEVIGKYTQEFEFYIFELERLKNLNRGPMWLIYILASLNLNYLLLIQVKFEVVSQKISLRACASVLNHVWFFVTTWTAACKAPLSTEFSRQEYWSGLPFSTPGDPPNPGIEPCLLHWQVNSLPLSHLGSPVLE